MRDFEGEVRSRAAALPLPSRILYTVFAALTLAGCVSCVVLYDGIVHFDARSTPQDLYTRLVAHYRDRPDLIETTHAHLFSMPVILLVAGHLFLLSSASPGLKLVAIVAACSATVLHLIAPWLVVWTGGSALGTVVYPISGGLLLLSIGLMLAVPVWEMWRRPKSA